MSQSSIAGDRDRYRYSTLGKTRKSASLGHNYPSSRDVACDMCTGNKRKAVKSCLACLASYCETHLLPHYEYPALMKHKLVEAAVQLQEKICSNHDKLLEVYCRTDQQCICVLCMMEEHKNHEMVSAATERTERQKQLGAALMKSQQRIQGRVKKWQDLKQAVASLKHSAQTAVEENERIFTELVRAIQTRHTEVRQQIQAQERAIVTQVIVLMDQLEKEVTELRRRQSELEELSHNDDNIHFIQSWQSLSSPSGYEDISHIYINQHSSFGPTKKAISALKERLEDVWTGELVKISATVKEVNILHAEEPRTREDFLQYSCQLTLDPNTVHRNLHLFDGNMGLPSLQSVWTLLLTTGFSRLPLPSATTATESSFPDNPSTVPVR
ncbi:hypothetical protein AAFF_G00364720 [Aldrovandia affinis]|uniref:B box-type domain-containing protein n=1 Tax=Aldrovandia affinis TaxID=143900 RepID=A0AAD7SHP0_9TELE|nr:hypothetical protein AAFF_G00364720 [Aldrovandia affinis]